MSDTADDPKGFSRFTVTRRLRAGAERLYAAFIEPAKLEHWFVVDGYRTPAARMRVTAEPGGRMEAVMVADADGSEIPFGVEYAELEPPHRLVLRFEDPHEVVTVTLDDLGEEGTDLVYDFASSPPHPDEDAARRGVNDMLDRIEVGIDQGII